MNINDTFQHKSLDELLDEARELYEKSENDKAAQLGEYIAARAISENNVLAQAHAYNTIGTTYFNRSLYEKALPYYIEADKILSAQHNPADAVPTLINLAIIYNQLQQFEKALTNYEKCIKLINESGNNKNAMILAQVYNGIGNVHNEMKSFQQAYESFEQVLQISKQAGIAFGEALALSNMSSTMLDMQQPEKAKHLATEAINISEKSKLKQLQLVSYRYYAEALMQLNNFEEAIDVLEKYLPEIIGLERKDLIAESYQLLGKAVAAIGNYEKAFHAVNEYASVSQQINSLEKSKMISDLQLRYDTEKKEAAIRELELKKQLAEKNKTEADLQSLKSRMNPHFIYNVMNTIQGLIHLDKKAEAIDAIQRFAHLTRLTLEHSGAKEVSVKDEAMLIKNYIETEQLLMGENFAYEISFSENIEDDFTFLPSLIVQPIVENAIKHGLMHKEGEKQLKINFNLMEGNNLLQITIEDNGIGRGASATLNAKKYNKPKSFATNAIAQRLQLLNESRSQPIVVSTIDLHNNSGVSCGTKVVVEIPQLYE